MDRTSIADAALQIADMAVRSARGEVATNSNLLPSGGLMVLPEELAQRSISALWETTSPLTPEVRRRERLVVYAYGEPALLLHLNHAGIAAMPVSHLNLRGPRDTPPTVPTFIVIGPHAKRTPGFWEQWMEQAQFLESVDNVDYQPGQVTLLDLFTPEWLAQHPESQVQKLELHRVR